MLNNLIRVCLQGADGMFQGLAFARQGGFQSLERGQRRMGDVALNGRSLEGGGDTCLSSCRVLDGSLGIDSIGFLRRVLDDRRLQGGLDGPLGFDGDTRSLP